MEMIGLPGEVFNRKEIKARILKHISQQQEINPEDFKSTLDPVVDLLLGACAFEFEKVYDEIKNTRSNIIKELVNYLIPDSYLGAKPASCLVHALPYDRPSHQLDIYNQFVFTRKLTNTINKSESHTDIYFSPLQNVLINNLHLKYIGSNSVLFNVENKRKLKVYANPGDEFRKEIFIGIEVFDKNISVADRQVISF